MVEDEKINEVFTWFGKVAYQAQCFEKELVIFFFFSSFLEKKDYSKEELEGILDKNSKKTLGNLINKLKGFLKIPEDLDKLLLENLDRRNFLLHDFFWHYAYKFPTEQGCNEMIFELKIFHEKFERADEIIQGLSKDIRKIAGISEEKLKQKAKEVLNREI